MPLNFLNNGIFPDNARLNFGTGSDMHIRHTGTYGVIENSVGDTYIKTIAADTNIYFQADDGSGGSETYFYLDGVGGGSQPFTVWPDDAVINLGTGHDLRLQHTGTTSKIDNYTGDLEISNYTDDGDISLRSDNGSGGTKTYLKLDGGIASMIGYTDLLFFDDLKLKFGDSQDLEIYHDGSHSYISDQGTGELKILGSSISIQSANGNEYIAYFQGTGGQTASLYAGNSKKFETTTNGATITGGLTTTASSTIAGANATADFLFLDNVKASFGTSGDLEIYHSGSHSFISDQGTGDLVILSNQVSINNAANSENIAKFIENGAVELYYDDSKKFETTSAGATVTGDLTVSGAIIPGSLSGYLPLSGGTMTGDTDHGDSVYSYWGASNDLQIYHDGTDSYVSNTQNSGNLIIQNGGNDKDVIFKCDDGSGGLAEYYRLDGGVERNIFSKNFRLLDDVQLDIGTSDDFRIVHTSANNNTYVQNFTGDLQIENYANDKDILFRCDDGSGGLETYFFLDGSTGSTKFPNNKKLVLGDSSDLRLLYDGSDSYIQADGAGHLYIQNKNTDRDIILQSDDGSGGETTYMLFDGSQTNIHTQVDFRIYDDKKLQLGNDADFEAFHDSAHMYMANNTGDWYITQAADNEDIIFRGDDGNGGAATYFYMDGSLVNGTSIKGATRFPDSSKIYMGTGGDLEIFHDGTDTYLENYTGSFNFTQHLNDGNMVFKCDDGSGGTAVYFTLDGGSSATNELYTKWPDYSRIALGTGKDLQLYHDGSDSFIKNSTGSLVIEQAAGAIALRPVTGENGILIVENAAVSLYYDNSKKLETNSGGVEVTGNTTTSGLIIGSGATVTTILDEDNMASDSATALATQQSIKAYVDSSTTGVLTYQGTWNADTNSPTLSSGSGTPGYYYIVSHAGSTNLDGITDWAVGDWAVFSDQATDAWQKIDNTAVGNVSGSGVDNRLVLWSGTSTVDSDSDFYVDGDTLYTDNLGVSSDINLGGNINKTSGNLTLDVAGDIKLSADGGDWYFQDGAANILVLTAGSNSSPTFAASQQDADIIFTGNDGGSTITALTLDMSDGGTASFNNGIIIPNYIYHTGDTNTYIGYSGADTFLVVTGGTTALTIDNSQAATFAGSLSAGACSFGTLNITDDIYHVGDTNTYFGFGGGADTFQIVTAGTSALTIDSSQAITCTGDLQAAGVYIGATNTSYDLYNNGTSYFNGNVIVDATLTVSAGPISISGDGSNAVTLTESGSGDFTIDAPDDIRLDAGGGDIALRDDGTEYGRITNNNPGLKISSSVTDSSINLMPNGSGNVYAYTDSVIIAGDEAETTQLMFRTDQGDDNGDDWIIKNPLDNILEFTNNISGSQVEHFSITPAATVADSIATFAGKVLIPSGYVGRDTHNYITFETDDQIVIRVADSHRLKLTSAAMLPYTDSSYDLGSTALRYSNIWVDNINGGTPTTGGPYLPLSGGTVSGNVAVTGTTTVGSSTGNGAALHGSKAQTLTEDTFTSILTVVMSDHTACYVKIFVAGDWSGHSSAQYLGEYFLTNGAGSYNEPGMIIREVDNTKTDSIVGKIVDPSGTSGNRDFVIQLKANDTVGTNDFSAKITYEVMGQYVSVS